MPDRSKTTYSPVADLRDLCSIPNGLGANDELHVPLPPRRDPSRWAPALRSLVSNHRAVTSFCYSDQLLLHWEQRVGEAEAAVARLAPAASLTLDIPYYGFMSPVQRERAKARALSAITRARRKWEPVGTEVVPLIKGLGAADWTPQLELAREIGLRRVGFYARECLLERDEALLHAFLRAVHAQRLRPVLVGLFRPRPPNEGHYDAASVHHYVLARHGMYLTRSGRQRRLDPGTYSPVLRRFLQPGDVASLADHNFRRARASFERPPPLTRFAM